MIRHRSSLSTRTGNEDFRHMTNSEYRQLHDPSFTLEETDYTTLVDYDEGCDVIDECAKDEIVWCQDFVTSFDESKFQSHHGTDAKVYSTKRGLLAVSDTFTQYRDQGMSGSMDNLKWLFLHNDRFCAIADETIFETVISACQTFNSKRPIPPEFMCRIRNVNEDYRLCCSAMEIYDPENGFVFYFLLTNDAIYAMYERRYRPDHKIPVEKWCHKEQIEKSASFSAVVYLQKRGNGRIGSVDRLDDCYRLGIGIDTCNGVVRWYIDHREVFAINRIGYRLEEKYMVLDYGGEERLFDIESFNIGIGHFTFLDHQLPNNYAREHISNDHETKENDIIRRSKSGLVMLSLKEFYREPYASLLGKRHPIDPCTSFAVTKNDKCYKVFGQGVVTLIKSMCVYHRRRSVKPIILPIREFCDTVVCEYVKINPDDIFKVRSGLDSCSDEESDQDDGFETIPEKLVKGNKLMPIPLKKWEEPEDCTDTDSSLRTVMGDTDLTDLTSTSDRTESTVTPTSSLSTTVNTSEESSSNCMIVK